jgi:hypothetical protein
MRHQGRGRRTTVATRDLVRRRGRWLLVLGTIVAALTVITVSWADEVVPDGDVVAVGDQASVNLGSVSPDQVLVRSVSFKLTCSTKNHVDSGQSLPLNFNLAGSSVPSGGSLSATNTSIGPVPASWPDDTTSGGSTNCGSPLPTPIQDNGDSTVTITAPSTAGAKSYTVRWNFGALTPSGDGDSNAVNGNHTDVTFTLTVVGDTTAPTINCTVPNQAIWYASDVTVNCAASDGGSGLSDAGDASFTLSTNVGANTESASAATPSHQVCDNAGNCATAGPYTFKVDKKAPVISTCDAADGSWHAGDVTLVCHYTDGGSGAGTLQVSLKTNVPADSEDANAAASANGDQACDAVANCADSPADIAGNMVDKKAPVISCGTADGLWHAADVSIACTASDGGSGVNPAGDGNFSLQTSVPPGNEDANASTGSKLVSDAVGNHVTAGPIAGNKVDKKAPVIACSSATFVLGQSPANVTGTATDGGSGPASQSLSAAADTSSIGTRNVTLSAKDNVENSGSKLCPYTVDFNFHGFFQPVDNQPTMNAVKAGSAVPVKFDLSGNQGLAIFAAGYPKTKVISCSDSSPQDDIESTVAAGGSSLSYDGTVNPPTGQYIYVWKTDKAWVGTCRELDVMLVDGTTRSAKFKFK